MRNDLPILDLDLQFIDIEGNNIVPEQSKFSLKPKKPEGKAAPESSGSCPELEGGDGREAVLLSGQPGDECPRRATWFVTRHPISLSIYVRDPKKVLALLEENARIKELLNTKFAQGLFIDPLHAAGIRSEDLQLEGFRGAFLSQLIREALQAHAVLHYDAAHGKKGFVFSFVRDECPFFSKAMPVAGRVLARSGYRIAGLSEPILDMRVGRQRLFLTQYEDRAYLANGLEALINVLESLPAPEKNLPDAPLVATVRAHAFIDNIPALLTGEPQWETHIALGVDDPGILQFPGGRYVGHLRAKIFQGIFAAIPHDAFAAVAASFFLPADMSVEEWQRLATKGPRDQTAQSPDEAGVAMIWDLSSQADQVSSMGIAIASQGNPGKATQFKQYFAHPGLTSECGGGSVFLAATSPLLLSRMRESCAGQSLSVLDWERGAGKKEHEKAQLFMFMNPGVGMRELFLAGGARSGDIGEFEPQWKLRFEKAKEAMRADGDKVFSNLPIFAYAGSATPGAKVVQLKGFTINQGASR